MRPSRPNGGEQLAPPKPPNGIQAASGSSWISTLANPPYSNPANVPKSLKKLKAPYGNLMSLRIFMQAKTSLDQMT